MHHTTNELWPRGEKPAQAFCGEDERLSVLAAHGTDSLLADPELEDIVALAAKICAAPIALVTVVERDRQVFLARLGLDAAETPRPTSFCAHAMLGGEAMVVPDATLDPRFAQNPLVTGEPHIRFYAGHPLVSSEGAPIGSLCVIDSLPRPLGLTELQRETLAVLGAAVMRRLGQERLVTGTRAALDRREEQLRRMIDSVPGIAFSADAQGNFDYFNAQWRQVTGADEPRAAADWAPFVHPEDFAPALARWQAAVGATARYEDRWRLRLADGSWHWMLSRVVPVIEEGGAARWFGVLTDIDAVHRETEAKELLASELSHRIKNIFAVISSLVAIRARGRPEVADFSDDLGKAIRTLGTAHDYVRPEGRSSDRLQELLRDLLAPYERDQAEQVSVSGADIALGAQAATPLALIFHELATNSAKYGALSQDRGRVDVEIARRADDGQDVILVTWSERFSGPAVSSAIAQEGFGSRLLRMAIEHQLGGHFTREFTADGIVIAIVLPAARIGD